MNKKILLLIVSITLLSLFGIFLYPRIFPSKPERTILYWTDPMIPGDKSDRPGKSPMGMERIPVYKDEAPAESARIKSPGTASYYTCPMHPSVHKGAPGVCPICGMTLLKKTDGTMTLDMDGLFLEKVSISPRQQVIANVSTTEAKIKSLEKEIHAVGKIQYAEPSFRQISTRFAGRLEKLYLTYTGQRIRKGDPVAEIYSPDAISAQREYLLAEDSYEQVKDQTEMISGGAKSLLYESRKKLLLWGITEEQIAVLDTMRQVRNTLTIYSPISGTVLKKNVDPQEYITEGQDLYDVADLATLWMYVDIYEYELQLVRMGQTVEATSTTFPGTIFNGRITFISPTLDPSTRTARLRVEFSNPNDELKLEMFMSATVKVILPPSIVVPSTAVLSTGRRQVVWVQKGPNLFEVRPVTAGTNTDGETQILRGLNEGDRVVSSGGYLIDSESQLQASNAPNAD